MSFRRVETLTNLKDRISGGLCLDSMKSVYTGMNQLRVFSALNSIASKASCSELPRKLKQSERKPWVVSVTELKRKARLERKEKQLVREKILQPPENGLLVKELVPVAHRVYDAREELITCVSRVFDQIYVYSCSVCGEVHVGHPPHKIRTCNTAGSLPSKEHNWQTGGVEHVMPTVESFHLYDRIGRAVSHKQRLEVDRIPAIVELCIQGGVDIPEYPTRRRTFPVYSVSGRIIDFERRFPKGEAPPGEDINVGGFWQKRKSSRKNKEFANFQSEDLQGIATQGLAAWMKMRSGVMDLMQKYPVYTCGYCAEVQVGPKGHRVQNCQAYKHQMRDGQHAWQEATFDDLVPPVYVLHVQDRFRCQPLIHNLKRYYGMLPAVLEMFAQAGATVGDDYAGLMREDVAVPDSEEEKWVV